MAQTHRRARAGFSDVEPGGLLFALHECWFLVWFLTRGRWSYRCLASVHSRHRSRGLKMPGLGRYDQGWGSGLRMIFKRLALIFSVVAMGLALNGCTKCGPIWDDWMQHSPKSCKSDGL